MPCTKPLRLAPELAGNFKVLLQQRGSAGPPRCGRDRDLQHHRSGPQKSSAPAAARPGPGSRPCRPPRRAQGSRRAVPAFCPANSAPRGGWLTSKRGEEGERKEEQDFRSLQLSVLPPALRSLAFLLSVSFLPSCLHTPPHPRAAPRQAAPAPRSSLPPLPQEAAAPGRGRGALPLRAPPRRPWAGGAGAPGVLAGQHISGGVGRKPACSRRLGLWERSLPQGIAWLAAGPPSPRSAGLLWIPGGHHRGPRSGRALQVRGSSIASQEWRSR